MAALTDKQLAAQIRNWRKKDIDGPFYGIRCDQPFSGSKRLEIDQKIYEVAECRSDLEAREVLARADQGAVLLFRLGHTAIGEDVLARLAKERLLPIDTRETLRELFRAVTIDPRILANAALVEALIATASAKGSVPTAAGALDCDLAWSILLDRPEIREKCPDATTLLRWSLSEEGWHPIRSLATEVRQAFFKWVAERGGEVIRFIEAASSAGHEETLVPVGLALGVLFGRITDDSTKLEGRVRIEDYLGKTKITSSAAMTWHLAATALVKSLSPADRLALARKTDDLLTAIKVQELAVESDFSEAGFSERLKIFAENLQGFGRRKSAGVAHELGASFQNLHNHILSSNPQNQQRLLRAEMAIRLAIWLKAQNEPSGISRPVEQIMDDYLKECSFVDRARFGLFGGDTGEPQLSQSYQHLAKQAAKIRRGQQEIWGTSLSQWNEDPQVSSPVKIEDVIEKFIVPLSIERPVLLLVLDGMSAPVFHELLEDLTQRDWFPISKPDGPVITPILAALPSVTEISRKALFAGKLDATDKRTEQVAFRDHPALSSYQSKSKPTLFLKGDLTNPGQSYLSELVREAIASPARRVLAVLLNVIDDQLSGADQLEIEWKIDRIRFLEAILDAASQAGRVVVITSDHGHVPDLNQTSKLVETGSGADRYRSCLGKEITSGEVRIAGPRILTATGEVALNAACDESIRYSSKKAGYHGGASDLETIIPLAVLDGQNDPPSGWQSCKPTPPAWWNWREALGEIPATATPAPASLRRTKPKSPSKGEPSGDLPLFSSIPALETSENGTHWTRRLLENPIYREQAKLMGKLAPKDSQVTGFLVAMERRGNSVLMETLANDMKMPPFRLRGLISSIGRLLNVDGYPVVDEERDSGTQLLNTKLLEKQFDITL